MIRLVVIECVMAALWLCSCGGASPTDLARAYLASDLDQQIQMFADDAVYVAVDGVTYTGRARIYERLEQAFSQNTAGEVLEEPHIEGDHVSWTRLTYSKLVPGVTSRLQQSMWVNGNKISRLTTHTT